MKLIHFACSIGLLCTLAIGLTPSNASTQASDLSATVLSRNISDYLAKCQDAEVCNGSFLIARNGRPIYVSAVGDGGDPEQNPLSAISQFDVGSISKEFTAVAVLRLARGKSFSLSDPVSKHLPTFPYRDVTIEQLLNHTSGIPDVLDYYSGLLRSGKASKPLTGADIIDVLARLERPARFPHGSQYDYNNTGYIVLAALVESKAGIPFSRYLEVNLFKPLGLRSTVLRTPENEATIKQRVFGFKIMPNGERKSFDQVPGFFIQGAGGIYSTVGDLHKWQQALNAGKILTPAEWKLATTPARLTDGSLAPYGLGISLRFEADQPPRLGHGGNYRGFISRLAYYPDSRLTVIVLTNNTPNKRVDVITDSLHSIALGKTPKAIRPSITGEVFRKVSSFDPATVHAWFLTELANPSPKFEFSEGELNDLGYWWMNGGEPAKAKLVFELTVLAFPKSANAYDSLAEALEAIGDFPKALIAAKYALELEPNSKIRLQRVTDISKRVH